MKHVNLNLLEVLAAPSVRCLVICQPWPWAIFHAPEPKQYENRTWNSEHRGPLLILAGQSRQWLDGVEWLRSENQPCPDADGLVFGAIVGIVNQVDAKHVEHDAGKWCSNRYVSGPWCHVYADARPFETPVPYSGQRGYFDVPTEVVAAELEKIRRTRCRQCAADPRRWRPGRVGRPDDEHQAQTDWQALPAAQRGVVAAWWECAANPDGTGCGAFELVLPPPPDD